MKPTSGGTTLQPGENHFSDWLSKHWGSENACTDSEQTTYYFECHPKHLKEGLDIFSGYFLNPLLKMDAVEREVTARNVSLPFHFLHARNYCL